MAINRADWKLIMDNDIAGERVYILPRRGVSLSIGLDRAFKHGFNRFSVYRQYGKATRIFFPERFRRTNFLVEPAAMVPLYRTDQNGEPEELETYLRYELIELDPEYDYQGPLSPPYCLGCVYSTVTESLLQNRHWFHADVIGLATIEKFCKSMECGFELEDGGYFHDIYALVERLREMQDMQNETGECCFWYQVGSEWKLRAMYDILLEDFLDEVYPNADMHGRHYFGPEFYPGYENRCFSFEYLPIGASDRLNEWYTQSYFMLYFAQFAYLESDI
jgi:hypothetical protein